MAPTMQVKKRPAINEQMARKLGEWQFDFTLGLWLTATEVAAGVGVSVQAISSAQLRNTLASMQVGHARYSHITWVAEKYPDSEAAEFWEWGHTSYTEWVATLRAGSQPTIICDYNHPLVRPWMDQPLGAWQFDFHLGLWLNNAEIAVAGKREPRSITSKHSLHTLEHLLVGNTRYSHIEWVVETYPDGPAAAAWNAGAPAYRAWLEPMRAVKYRG